MHMQLSLEDKSEYSDILFTYTEEVLQRLPRAKGNTYQRFREWLRETFTGGVPTEDEVATIIKEVDSDIDDLRPVPQETLDLFSSPENSQVCYSPENH